MKDEPAFPPRRWVASTKRDCRNPVAQIDPNYTRSAVDEYISIQEHEYILKTELERTKGDA